MLHSQTMYKHQAAASTSYRSISFQGVSYFGVSNDVQGLLQDVMQESEIDPFYLVFLFNWQLNVFVMVT
jgi:hypothetical protein